LDVSYCTNLTTISCSGYSGLIPISVYGTGCSALDTVDFNFAVVQNNANIDFSFCQLSEPVVNDLIDACWNANAGAKSNNVYMDLSGGSNIAPGAAQAAEVLILNSSPYNNSIFTN